MFKEFLAKRAFIKANRAANTYRKQPGNDWNVLVQIALDRRACDAANRYAVALNGTAAILRAW